MHRIHIYPGGLFLSSQLPRCLAGNHLFRRRAAERAVDAAGDHDARGRGLIHVYTEVGVVNSRSMRSVIAVRLTESNTSPTVLYVCVCVFYRRVISLCDTRTF